MEFREFVEVIYPVAKGVQPGPVDPSNPQTWPDYDYWRIIKGKHYYPSEREIVERQKNERKQFGVVFTPFKLDISAKANPWKDIG